MIPFFDRSCMLMYNLSTKLIFDRCYTLYEKLGFYLTLEMETIFDSWISDIQISVSPDHSSKFFLREFRYLVSKHEVRSDICRRILAPHTHHVWNWCWTKPSVKNVRELFPKKPKNWFRFSWLWLLMEGCTSNQWYEFYVVVVSG